MRTAGGVALVFRRITGIVLVAYFAVWLAGLGEHALVPFGGDLGRGGSAIGKALEMVLIGLLSAHAVEGLSQVLVERLRLMRQRAFLLGFAVIVGALFGGAHVFWFVGRGAP